jgi:mono/diheme cytochrome c family protein
VSSSARRWRAALLVVALGAQSAAGETASATIWDGVYTAAQASRGRLAYTGPCDRCHGYKLDGASEDPDMLPAPPIAGAKFLREWNGRPLAALFDYTRATMPANNPGYLADGDIADIIAYMLAVSGAPAGEAELRSDAEASAAIVIVPRR